MVYFEDIMDTIEYFLETRQRRHIVGGALISMSALFCGLAITLMTIEKEAQHGREKDTEIIFEQRKNDSGF